MATYTTTLSLRKPQRTGGTDDIIDVVSDVNNNLDIIDQNVNMRVATAVNRPSSPYTGQLIYETDTAQVRIWSGSSWDLIGTDNSARGKVSGMGSTSTTGGLATDGTAIDSSAAENLYIRTTFAAESDRRYWVEAGFHVGCTATTAAPGSATVNIRWAAGATVANTDTQLCSVTYTVPQGTGEGNAERGFLVAELAPATTGNVTVGLFLKVPNANDTMRFEGVTNNLNWLSVRDVGI